MSYFVFLLFFVNFESIVHQVLTILAFYDDTNVAFFLRKLLFNQICLSRPVAPSALSAFYDDIQILLLLIFNLKGKGKRGFV